MRDLAPDADLETLYGAAKFAATREGRHTTHPLMRDARGLSVVSGDVTGLLTVTGELTGSRDPASVDREQRAPAIPAAMGVNRPGTSFHEESARPPVPDRRREGFPDRHAWPTMSSPRVPPRPYVPRARYGFEDVPGRHQGHPAPRGRAADRRYSADPRPVRWPQVHVMNVQPYNPRGNSVVESYMRTLKTTLKLCAQAFQTDWDVALQAVALAYRATPHTVTGHTPFFLVAGQKVVLPLSREWHQPALCPLGVAWLDALWRCRVEVIKAHELAADENARAQTFQTSRLRPGNHVALRLTKAERQTEGTFSRLFTGP